MRSVLLFPALSAMLLPDLALAQSKQSAPSDELSVDAAIVVTARKREENLQQVPIAVTAVSAEAITQRNLTELRDIQNVAPNVLFTESQGLKGTARIFIRGVGENLQIFSADPAVGVYVDGIPLSRPQGANLSLLDVERIEVLRGPQGTTFGKNTIGGSINYVSKHPGDSFSGVIKGRIGNYSALNLEGAINLPVSDTLALRVSGQRDKRDGFVHNDFDGGDLSDANTYSGRVMAEWRPTEALNILASADYFHRNEKSNVPQMLSFNIASPLISLFDAAVNTRYGFRPFARSVDNDPYRGFYSGGASVTPGQPSIVATDPLRSRYKLSSEPNMTKQRIWGGYLIATLDLGDAYTLKSLNSYRKTLSNSWFDSWGVAVPASGNVLEENSRELSTELQLLGNDLFDGKGNFILGAYAGRTTAYEVGTQWFQPELMASVFNFTTGRDQRQITKSIAFFGNAAYELTSQLQVTVGARWTKDTKNLHRLEFATFPTGTNIGFGPAIPPARPTATGAPFRYDDKKSWDAWSGVISAQYQWTPEVMTYAGWSRGFRSGGFSGSGRSLAELIPYDPETVDSYEAGLRSRLFDNKLTFNLTGFFMNYKNRQMQLIEVLAGPPVVSRSRIFNAGRSEQKGIELETVLRPVDPLQITAAYGYTDAKYTKLAGPFAVGGNVAVDLKKKLPQTPKHTFNTGVTYTIGLGSGDEIALHGDYSYRSRIYYDLANSPETSENGYGVLNARLSWRSSDKSWDVALWARNITKERYKTDGIAVPGIFSSAYFGDPRTYGIELTKSF